MPDEHTSSPVEQEWEKLVASHVVPLMQHFGVVMLGWIQETSVDDQPYVFGIQVRNDVNLDMLQMMLIDAVNDSIGRERERRAHIRRIAEGN
jgi:hypothetical protein